MYDDLIRFLIKSRAGIQFTSRENMIFQEKEVDYVNAEKLAPWNTL
jgi:hypothetical protein